MAIPNACRTEINKGRKTPAIKQNVWQAVISMQQNARGERIGGTAYRAVSLLGSNARTRRKGSVKTPDFVSLGHRIEIIAGALGDRAVLTGHFVQRTKQLAKECGKAASVGKIGGVRSVLACCRPCQEKVLAV